MADLDFEKRKIRVDHQLVRTREGNAISRKQKQNAAVVLFR